MICMVRSIFEARDGTRTIIRELVKTDAEQLMRHANRVIDEPMSGLSRDKKIVLKEEIEWLKRRLEDIHSKRAVTLVAELDGQVVGRCDIDRRRNKESHRAVLGIAVRKELRGKGIGEELINRTIQLARQRMKGLEQIDLMTISYNKRAQRLYKKLGFVRTGFVPRAIKEGNEYYGEHVMVLYL